MSPTVTICELILCGKITAQLLSVSVPANASRKIDEQISVKLRDELSDCCSIDQQEASAKMHLMKTKFPGV